MIEKIETVIVGGGQAGLALSYFLSQAGRDHVILEKAAQAGEAWRNKRWDSFTLVTPNWSFQLPGGEYQGDKPDEFMPRIEVVRRFEEYIEQNHLPVTYNNEVNSVEPLNGVGFLVSTVERKIQARNVVIATGLYQKDKRLPLTAQMPASILQIDSSQYRNPNGVPPGAVLVVGSAQSGCQIAEELAQSGRSVYLATGKAGWVPRHYRGRDGFIWASLIGFLDRTPDVLPSPHMRFIGNPSWTGKDGGHNLNLHTLHRQGVTLLGRLQGFQDGRLILAADVAENVVTSDRLANDFFKMIDKSILDQNLSAPEEALAFPKDAYQAQNILELDLAQAGVRSVVWACGHSFDFSLVKLPVTDKYGFPVTQKGVTNFPGLYFLGMPWLNRFKSGLLFGISEDAAFLADHIVARM